MIAPDSLLQRIRGVCFDKAIFIVRVYISVTPLLRIH